MPWNRSDNLISSSLRRHGLDGAIAAGTVCLEAERLYPGLFKATSLVDGVLRITVTMENQIQLRAIEGKLLEELKAFASSRSLPIPTRIRLTVSRSSATL
jgi:hypothetical protein